MRTISSVFSAASRPATAAAAACRLKRRCIFVIVILRPMRCDSPVP